jgi:DNA-binding transcriptional MerR regulator
VIKENLVKIGELARLSGLSERTIRYYEKLGIIRPRRSDGGTRLYSENEEKIASTVNMMRELEIPIEVIKLIANKRSDFHTGDQSSKAMVEILEALADELRDRITKSLSLQDELIRTVRLVQGCRGCKNKPTPEDCPDCPLQTENEPTNLARIIWQSDQTLKT